MLSIIEVNSHRKIELNGYCQFIYDSNGDAVILSAEVLAEILKEWANSNPDLYNKYYKEFRKSIGDDPEIA